MKIVVMVAAVVGPIVACRDVLGIAGQTTIGDGAVLVDGSGGGDSGVLNTTQCGTKLGLFATASNVGAFALVAQGGDVFWVDAIDASSGAVRGWVAGQVITIADQQPDPVDLRVDSSFVYWNAFNTYNGIQGPPILRAWSRSSKKTVDFPLGPLGLTAGKLAIDSANLYFGEWLTNNQASVYAISLPLGDAGGPRPLAGGLSSPLHVVADPNGGALYFDDGAGPNEEGATLWSVPLDGGTASALKTNTTIKDIVVVNGDAYWPTGGNNTIEGTNAFSVSVPAPYALVVEPSNTYFYALSARDTTDELDRVRVADGAIVTCAVADELGSVTAVSGHLYFSARTGTTWGIYDLATP